MELQGEMSLFSTALDPTGKDLYPNTHPGTVWVPHPRCGTGMSSTGWGEKNKKQHKNNPQFSASLPCDQPNEGWMVMVGLEWKSHQQPPVGDDGGMDVQERSGLQKCLVSPCKWVCSSFHIYSCINCHLIANYFYLLAIISDFCN